MTDFHRKLEVSANLAIVIFTVVFGSLFISKFLGSAPPAAHPATRKLDSSSRFELEDINWASHEKNLVIAFSPNCGYCRSSAEFYKQIGVRRKEHDNVRIIVISSQPASEVKSFLDQSSISVDAPLSDVSINGTPTLVLIGPDGLVKNSWIGRLPPERETEVFEALFSG